jgi:hypothetical protein
MSRGPDLVQPAKRAASRRRRRTRFRRAWQPMAFATPTPNSPRPGSWNARQYVPPSRFPSRTIWSNRRLERPFSRASGEPAPGFADAAAHCARPSSACARGIRASCACVGCSVGRFSSSVGTGLKGVSERL